MPIPSARTIAQRLGVASEIGDKVRTILQCSDANGWDIPRTLDCVSCVIGAYGAEYIPPGRGRASPSIEYANRGDTYAPTVLYLDGITTDGRPTGRGRWSVGSWGDIVERGNYA